MKALIWLFGLFVVMPMFVLGPIAAVFGVINTDLWLALGGVVAFLVALKLAEWVHART